VIKNALKSYAKCALVAYLGFQAGSNFRAIEMNRNYAVIPLEIVQKYGSNFRELVSDAKANICKDALEDIIFHDIKTKKKITRMHTAYESKTNAQENGNQNYDSGDLEEKF